MTASVMLLNKQLRRTRGYCWNMFIDWLGVLEQVDTSAKEKYQCGGELEPTLTKKHSF